jgi:hypothetical protein
VAEFCATFVVDTPRLVTRDFLPLCPSHDHRILSHRPQERPEPQGARQETEPKKCQPAGEEAQVVARGAEQRVDRVAVGAGKVASNKRLSTFM